MRRLLFLYVLQAAFFVAPLGAADEGWETITVGPSEEVVEEIRQAYLDDVKPIFAEKCLSCHGQQAKPWYAAIPGVKQLIERDVREAKGEMDMSRDIPFVGHGRLEDDLEALQRTLRDESMPPWQYRMVHWNSLPTKEEKKLILKWIEQSLVQLNKGERE